MVLGAQISRTREPAIWIAMPPSLIVTREHQLRADPLDTLRDPRQMAATAATLRQTQNGESDAS